MKKSSRLALLVIGSVFFAVVPVQESQECIDYPQWEQYRVRFFDPGLADMEALSPFYFTRRWMYKDELADVPDDHHRNIKEWQTWLGPDVLAADIDSVLYGDDKLGSLLTSIKLGTLAEDFPNNSFIKKIQQRDKKPALDYLLHLKQMEFLLQAPSDPWNDNYGNDRDTTFFNTSLHEEELYKTALERLEKTNDPFLQKRYAYQAILSDRYSGSDSLVMTRFDQHFNEKDTTILMPYALLYKAECLPKKDSLTYNYLLSKVFDLCDDKKVRTVNLFVTAWTEQTVAVAPTPHDKAMVLVMNLLQNPGFCIGALKRIHQWDPHNKYLPMLISREINKLEDWMLTKKMTGHDDPFVPGSFYDKFYEDDSEENTWEVREKKKEDYIKKQYLNARADLMQLRSWVETLERSGDLQEQQDFMRLAAAHLHFLSGNHRLAQFYLSKISKSADEKLQAQKAVEQLLLVPFTQNLKDAATLNRLATELQEVWKKPKGLDRPAELVSRLHLYFCNAMFAVENIPAAGLLYNKAWMTSTLGGNRSFDNLEFFDAHATVTDMTQLIEIQQKKAKTNFEKYLLEPGPVPENEESTGGGYYNYDGNYYYSESTSDESFPTLMPMPEMDELHYLQGTIAFRDGNLQQSLQSFEKVSPEFWAEYYHVDTDIFADAGHFPFEKKPARGPKTEVVRHFIELESESKKATGERLAEMYYQLGNGWYNVTWYGRSWFMFSEFRQYDDDDSPEIRNATRFRATPDLKRYGKVYFRCERALEWYRRALNAHPSKELAAKIEYMIAQCDKDIAVMEYNHEDHPSDYPSSPLFKKWAARYGGTATFAERMLHCPELKEYLGR